MNRTRLGQLEKRKGRPLEALREIADATSDAPVDLRPRLLGAAGLALGRLGLPDAGAETVRRALELANAAANHPEGRRLLRHLDTLEDIRPPFRISTPSKAQVATARKASARARGALELPELPPLDLAELEDMDALRYQHPEAALCRLLPAADRLPAECAVLLLAVTGSAYRLRGGQREEIEADLRRAEQHLQAGLWSARKTGDVAGQADLLQRLGYVIADRGDHRHALELAERATGIYCRIGDRAGRGKALVDQGVFLNGLGRPREGIRAQTLALEILPETDRKYRVAAFQGLGHLHRTVGDLEAAIGYLNQASAIKGVSPAFAARLVWLRGSVFLDLGNKARAAESLSAAVDSLRTVHYADAALATVELVHVLILLGRHDEAHRVAFTVRELVIPLQRNHHVSAALAELIRGGRSALTLGRVERVRTALERARRRPSWRLYRVRSGRQA